MEAITSAVTTLGATFFDTASNAVDFVMEHPIALLGCVSMLIVTGVGLAKSLVRGM
jgi:hypothetical protein